MVSDRGTGDLERTMHCSVLLQTENRDLPHHRHAHSRQCNQPQRLNGDEASVPCGHYRKVRSTAAPCLSRNLYRRVINNVLYAILHVYECKMRYPVCVESKRCHLSYHRTCWSSSARLHCLLLVMAMTALANIPAVAGRPWAAGFIRFCTFSHRNSRPSVCSESF